jgi:hypothetical protein
VQFSRGSCTQSQHFGFNESFVVHIFVQLLHSVQLSVQSSHTSVHSGILFQQIWFGFTNVQDSEQFQLCQLKFDQSSHCSQGSLIQLPHDQVHLPVSVEQFLQLSAASISLFQQYALHSHTSLGQFLQFSLASAFQSQHHVLVQSSMHFSHKSSGHVSHVSPILYW